MALLSRPSWSSTFARMIRPPARVAGMWLIACARHTDTTACVAGGIAGLRFGMEGIPQRWRAGLREPELFLPLLEQLLARA